MKRAIGVVLRALDLISKPKVAYAHCDIPCGVYETDSAAHAAQTVYALTEKLLKLELLGHGDEKSRLAYVHTAARMTEVKEKFAQICKQELLILWTDYFKPEHMQKYPNLHDTFWKAAKQCSTAKREVNLESAQKLKDMVAEVARIFAETKK
ncbi:superoxide dismutase, Ni [Candidatus Woesearchaeota archaeon]|nr:superoxide dismutase, Ni [Candidatus Woesearchaeota archaeon]